MQQAMWRIICRGWNAPSKVQLRYLEISNHQERLNDRNKGTREGFRGYKIVSKVKKMYLKIKLKEVRFDWWV